MINKIPKYYNKQHIYIVDIHVDKYSYEPFDNNSNEISHMIDDINLKIKNCDTRIQQYVEMINNISDDDINREEYVLMDKVSEEKEELINNLKKLERQLKEIK